MNIIKSIVYYILKLRIHVSVVYFFVICSIVESTLNASYKKFIVIIVCFSIWHFSLYLFDRAYDANLDYLNNPAESLKGNHRKHFLYFSIFLPIMQIFILYFYNQPILPYLFLLPITYLYNVRIFPKKRAIKHFTVIKNMYSAVLIWPLPIAIILKYYAELDNYLFEIMYWFWGFILCVFMGEIIWDIRDVDGDKIEGIETIPVKYGIKNTKLILIFIILIYFLINYYYFNTFNYVLILFYLLYILISTPKLPKILFHIPIFIAILYYILKFIIL